MSVTITVRWDHPDDEVQARAIGAAIPLALPVGLMIPIAPTVQVEPDGEHWCGRDER